MGGKTSMKKKLILTAISATMSIGLLAACGVDNNNLNDTNDGNNIRPVRYDRQNDLNPNIYNQNPDNPYPNVNPVRYNNDYNNYNGGLRGVNNERDRVDDDGVFDNRNNNDNDLFDNDNDRDNDLFDLDDNNRNNGLFNNNNQTR